MANDAKFVSNLKLQDQVFISNFMHLAKSAKDICEGVVCRNGGICISHGNRYSCNCRWGFGGKHCDRVRGKNYNKYFIICGVFELLFREYIYSYYSDLYLDEDDFSSQENKSLCDPNPCQNSAICTQTAFGYECICEFGWTGEDCEISIKSMLWLEKLELVRS